MLAANARIIVQCFLERLPFDVLEDHTVWIAPNKTVHSKGSIEGREGARVARRQQVRRVKHQSPAGIGDLIRAAIEGILPPWDKGTDWGCVFRSGSYPPTPIT